MAVQNLEIKPLILPKPSTLKFECHGFKEPEFYPTEQGMQEMQRENTTNSVYTLLCHPLKLSIL